MSTRAATPNHCPFCGDEDLRPVEDDATAWSCRSCARVFSVSLVRFDQSGIPANHVHSAHPVDPVGSTARHHGGHA